MSQSTSVPWFRLALLVSSLDVVPSLCLFLIAGREDEGSYLQAQVLSFSFLTSTFDLLVYSLFRSLALLTIFANQDAFMPPKKRRKRRRSTETTSSSPPLKTSSNSPSSQQHIYLRVLAIAIPISSVAYLTIKVSLGHQLLFSNSHSSGISSVGFNAALLGVSLLSSLLEVVLFVAWYRVSSVNKNKREAVEGSAEMESLLVTSSATLGHSLNDGDDDEAEEEEEEEEEEEGGCFLPPKKPGEKPEKVEIKHASLGRLIKLAYPERWILVWSFFGLCLSSASNLAMPVYFGRIIEVVTIPSEDTRSELGSAMWSLVVIFAIGGITAFAREWLFILAGQRIVARLRKDLFKATISQEVAYFDATRTGELTNRLSSDTTTLQTAIAVNLDQFLGSLIEIIGSLVLLFVTSPSLTAIMLGIVPVVGIGAVIYARHLEKLGKEFQDQLAKASATAEEMISNIRTVRSFSREKKAHQRYSDDIQESYNIGRRLAIANGSCTGLLTFIGQSAIALVIYEGALRVLKGSMTSGTLTSFVLYTITLALSAAGIAYLFGEFMTAVGSTERIFELLDRVPTITIEGGLKNPTVLTGTISSSSLSDEIAPLYAFEEQGGKEEQSSPFNDENEPVVELRNVVFSYPTRLETTVLKDLSLVLRPGTITALVGPSGGGKSTIVSLIERFYDPIEGDVLFKGNSLKTLDPVWYRRRIGLVSQEPVLFACTIKENITYGVVSATQEQIEDAARQANAHEFIMNFPEQYDTVVGERGVRLSGGQKQRIAIARALLMDPMILLLDEATSALDAESEHLVQEAIDRAMLNRTVLVVAHRLSTVRSASRVVVISDGVIAESGTHEELVALDGIYKKLVERQLQ